MGDSYGEMRGSIQKLKEIRLERRERARMRRGLQHLDNEVTASEEGQPGTISSLERTLESQ